MLESRHTTGAVLPHPRHRRTPQETGTGLRKARLTGGRSAAFATALCLGVTFTAVVALSPAPAHAAPADDLQTTDTSLAPASPSPRHHARGHAIRHGRSANNATPDQNTASATAPRSLESQEQAPPPPDGYEPVQDMDVVLEAHSPQITAQKGAGLAPVDAQQVPRMASNATPVATVFGIPVRVSAPVVPPYNGSFTYTTYGGQAGNGRNAPGAWGAAGEP